MKYLCLLALLLCSCDYRVQAGVAEPVKPIVKAAMKFHGIRSCTIDDTGYAFFYRDGKRCRLITRGFLKKWRDKGE